MLNPLSFISKIFKSSNDIELAKFRKILEKINSLPKVVEESKELGKDFRRNEIRARWAHLFRDAPKKEQEEYTILKIRCKIGRAHV